MSEKCVTMIYVALAKMKQMATPSFIFEGWTR